MWIEQAVTRAKGLATEANSLNDDAYYDFD
jgi:hypothetical protein